MSVSIILYPPVLDSWMPSFIQFMPPVIHFSISKYNAVSDIKYIQVTCVAQDSNVSILKKDVYTAGILMLDASTALVHETDDKYNITIPITAFTNNQLENNKYYKVQIRFASTEASDWDGDQTSVYSWNNYMDPVTYISNLECLSEWSRVCLLKPISMPYLTLTGFNNGSRTYNTTLIDIDGKLNWSDGNEHETLDHYTITVKNSTGTTTLYTSDIIYVNSEDPNSIYHSIEYLFDVGTYQISINYETSNGYTPNYPSTFTVIISIGTITPGFEEGTNLYVIPYEEESCICIHLTTDANINSSAGQSAFKNNQNTLLDLYRLYQNQSITAPNNVSQYIMIVRASNEDNYTRWYDLHSEYIADYTNINYIYFDYTAEAGVLYKYAVQIRNTDGDRSALLYETGATVPTHGKMIAPEYITLISEDEQFSIKFNGSISSLKYNISENATDTIGSQFAFVMRNGNVKYRTFNISGTISSLTDLECGEIWNTTTNRFYENSYETKKRQFYGNDYEDYNQYNSDHNIIIQRDAVYEKKYRDKIIDFLLNGKPKLFKSTPEGNIMCYLMNVSLNTEKTTNFIYSFQATVYEIALCNIQNYETYGIIEKINKFA